MCVEVPSYRTESYNRMLDVIYKETKRLRGKNKTESLEKSGDSVSVPRTGIEYVNLNECGEMGKQYVNIR